MPTVNKYIKHILPTIPHQPGVYKMLDSDKNIIYVGKAKDLHKRVKSYFQNNHDQNAKTLKMVEQIEDMQYILTGSELEALILETNLIKELRPKYNILMKDDKNFAYIKITTNEDYPRILIVRKILKDHARYFGPKTAASRYYDILHLLRKIFPFRNCGLDITDLGPASAEDINRKRLVKVTRAGIKYPCLDLHIKRCLAPCVGKPDQQEYRAVINKIIDFLEGRYQTVLSELKEQMYQAAKNKLFEHAAKLRDKIQSIQSLFEYQIINSTNHQNTDIINYYQQDTQLYFNVFQIREGKLIDQQNTILKSPSDIQGESAKISAFLQNFYLDNNDIPKEILLPVSSGQDQIIEDWLSKLSGHRVRLTIPQKGKKDKLLDMSLENAVSFAKQSQIKWEADSVGNREEGLEKLAQILGLPKIPKRVECYDISHLSGTHTVASMAVFESGFPKKDQYRHFKISLEVSGKPDDFSSMKEVLLRRLKYIRPHSNSNPLKIKKQGAFYQIKQEKTELGKIKILSSGKLKTFLGDFRLAASVMPDFFSTMAAKIDSKRIYFPIKQKDISSCEALGLQAVKTEITDVKIRKGSKWLVYDKSRHHQDDSFKKIPDLVVVDGGKGQLTQAIKATEQYHLKIPILSLAKKEEEIFLPGQKTPVLLAENDPARLLLQHIRDEAHRFAIEYNRKLRKKDYTVSALEEIPGIGKKTTMRLLKEFGSIENILSLPEEKLSALIGYKSAIKLKKHFS